MINLNEAYAFKPDEARFSIGQVVRHLRYEYRALIVAFDPTCQAPADWYLANQTQPNKAQPWYHLLVDGAQHVTYAAQSNLDPDETGQPVVHPMLNLFFFGYEEGANRYLRNDVPWNPGEPPEAPPPPPTF